MTECCEEGTKLIYSCTGSADVGEIAERGPSGAQTAR